MRTKIIISSVLVFGLLVATIANLAFALPNPASVYCGDMGYDLEIRSDKEGNQYGVCIFPDGECGQWEFYNGTCKPPPCASYGDVNLDGVITSADADMISGYIVGNIKILYSTVFMRWLKSCIPPYSCGG